MDPLGKQSVVWAELQGITALKAAAGGQFSHAHPGPQQHTAASGLTRVKL